MSRQTVFSVSARSEPLVWLTPGMNSCFNVKRAAFRNLSLAAP